MNEDDQAFRINTIMGELGQHIFQTLAQKNSLFFLMVAHPQDDGSVGISTVQSIPSDLLPELLKAQIEAQEQNTRAKSVSEADLADLGKGLEAQETGS